MSGSPTVTPPPPPVPQAATPAPAIAAATVEQSPPNVTHAEGKVIASNPNTGEIRIATQKGDVVIISPTPLPPETPVAVDLYLKKSQMLANITVLRQQAAQAEEIKEIIAPPVKPAPLPLPPIKTGDVLMAVYLPQNPLPPVTMPQQQPLPPEKVAILLEEFKLADILKLPQPLPLPADILKQFLTAQDKPALFKTLPPVLQQEIGTFLAQPKIVDFLKSLLPPQKFAMTFSAVAPAQAPLSVPDTIDNNLLEIMRAQVSVKLTQSLMEPAAATPAAKATPLGGLMPLIESLIAPDRREKVAERILPQLKEMAARMPDNLQQVKITSIHPPSTPLAQQGPGIFQGLIDSITPAGFPVIKSEGDLFILKTTAPIPVGSTVMFEAAPLTPQQALTALMPQVMERQGFDPLRDISWPALDEALQTLTAATPDAAAIIKNSLPSPSPRMAPAALFFLAALKGGMIESWLGEKAIDTLRAAGKKDLVEKLAGDFGRMSAQSRTPLAGEWRAISMPMMNDDQISQMQFFVRQQQDQDEKDEKDDGIKKPTTRFILNLRLSRMGDLQIDGLLRKKQFDMILRTEEELASDTRRELMQAFARGVEQAGMQGGLSFQSREKWVNVALA